LGVIETFGKDVAIAHEAVDFVDHAVTFDERLAQGLLGRKAVCDCLFVLLAEDVQLVFDSARFGDFGLKEHFVADVFGVEEEEVIGRRRALAEEHGVWRDIAGIEAGVGPETKFREEFEPVDGRADVVVSGFVELVGRGGKEDSLRGSAEIGDGGSNGFRHEMFENFDAGDEIVLAGEGIEERADFTVRLNVATNLGDGVFGDVDAFAVNAAIPKLLNQKAHGATRIENATWAETPDGFLSDDRKKMLPVIGALVRDGTETESVVIGAVVIAFVLWSGCFVSHCLTVPWYRGYVE
jgi:hypothetical protein